MSSQLAFRRTRSLWMVLLGIFLVTFGFTTYPVMAALNLDREIGSEVFVVIYAYFALALDIVGLCLLFSGLTNVLTRWPRAEASGTGSSLSGALAAPFVYRRYSRLLLASAFAYGLFYAFASGTVVFQPAFSFSEAYHVGIPSVAIATCCGPVGEAPQAVAYLSQHLGLFFIPVNLLLLFSISWLVGLNASFASFALSFRTENARIGWLGGTGAFIGLFTSCPTCAGLAIVSVLGGTGILSASFFLGSLRTIIVAISIPILVAVPLLSARSLNTFNGRNCVIS